MFKIKVYLSAFNGNFSNIIDLLVKYEEQNINICDAQGRTSLQMAVRYDDVPAVKKLVYLGAEVSVVKAVRNDAIRLERKKMNQRGWRNILSLKRALRKKPLSQLQNISNQRKY